MLRIKTDHKWRPFLTRDEVPERVLATRFDYLDGEEEWDGFFRYRGWWYHLSDFMRCDAGSPFPGPWQGYHGDSFFSGVLLEVSRDGERFRVGTYTS